MKEIKETEKNNGKNATEQEKEPVKSKGRLIYEELMSWVKPIAFAVIAALILDNFIIVNATVPTGSMENTIEPGDRLMGNRLSYLRSDPERGDIVIFRYPVNERENYIKRIVGLPGETVEIMHGKIYINGSPNPLEESYLKEEWVIQNDGFIFEVPEGCYLMLGDNRNNSKDSRYWADEAVKEGLTNDRDEALNYCYVAKEKILGKAMFTYWPSISGL